MSLLYLTGSGVENNLFAARSLAHRAADKGDPLGRAVLGAMMRDGIGGPGEPVSAFELLRSTLDSNLGYAHFQLGIAYERGVGTAVDREKAAESYRKALAGGVTVARQRLQAMGFSE